MAGFAEDGHRTYEGICQYKPIDMRRFNIPPPWLTQITGARGTLVPVGTVISEMLDVPRRKNRDVRMPIKVIIAKRLKVMVGNLWPAMQWMKRP